MTIRELIKLLHSSSNDKVCKTGQCQVQANYENNNNTKAIKEMEAKNYGNNTRS